MTNTKLPSFASLKPLLKGYKGLSAPRSQASGYILFSRYVKIIINKNFTDTDSNLTKNNQPPTCSCVQ